MNLKDFKEGEPSKKERKNEELNRIPEVFGITAVIKKTRKASKDLIQGIKVDAVYMDRDDFHEICKDFVISKVDIRMIGV